MRALCSLSHPALLGVPPPTSPTSPTSPTTSTSDASDASGAFYWNSATALHTTVQLHGIRVVLHQDALPSLPLPEGSWKNSARNYYVQGNVLHAELEKKHGSGWAAVHTRFSEGDRFRNSNGRFENSHRGTKSSYRQERDVALVQLNRLRLDVNHHVGRMGEDLMFAVGSFSVVDLLEGLEESMAISTPNAEAYHPNADRRGSSRSGRSSTLSSCLGLGSRSARTRSASAVAGAGAGAGAGGRASSVTATDGSHEDSQLTLQPDMVLSAARTASPSHGASCLLHLEQLQLDARSPVRLFTGVPLLMRLVYWWHRVETQMQLDAAADTEPETLKKGDVWTRIDHISISRISLAVWFNNFSGNDNHLHQSNENKPADSLADMLIGIYRMDLKGLMKEAVKLVV